MSSQQNPHTQAEPRRFGRTRLGSVQGLVWFASLMVLLLLIVVAVFDMRVAGIMRPATTDAASAPADQAVRHGIEMIEHLDVVGFRNPLGHHPFHRHILRRG